MKGRTGDTTGGRRCLFVKKRKAELCLHVYLFLTFCFTEQTCLGPDCLSLCLDAWQDAVNIPGYPDVVFEKLKSVIHHQLWNKENGGLPKTAVAAGRARPGGKRAGEGKAAGRGRLLRGSLHGRRLQAAAACLALHLRSILLRCCLFRGCRPRRVEPPGLSSAALRLRAARRRGAREAREVP